MVYTGEYADEARTQAFVAVVSALAACAQEWDYRSSSVTGEPPVLTAAGLGDQAALTAADFLAMQPYARAVRTNFQRQAQLCRVCRSLERNAPQTSGPNRFAIFGRANGTQPRFNLSQAIREARFRWTPAEHDAWLAEPARFLPGKLMSFSGIREAGDRADLIAWLLAATSDS